MAQSVQVFLTNLKLWKEFVGFPNEMRINKAGVKMFPIVKLKLSGFDAKANYKIKLEFIQGIHSYTRNNDSGVPEWHIKENAEHLQGLEGNEITTVLMVKADFEYNHQNLYFLSAQIEGLENTSDYFIPRFFPGIR